MDSPLAEAVEGFSRFLASKLLDRSSTFAKEYLRAVVREIRVKDGIATVSGSGAQLLQLAAAVKQDEKGPVPRFIEEWRARLDSNQ